MTKKLINYFMIRAISAIVLGALLILCHRNAIIFVVYAVGVFFIVPGLISLINYFTSEEAKRPDAAFLFAGIGSLLFGVVLIAAPNFFINVLMYLLGIILIIGAIEQIVTLIRVRKMTDIPVAFYVIPLLILIAGILVLFNPFKTAATIFILIGITCLIYGIMECVHWLKFKRKNTNDTIVDAELLEDAE